MAGRKKGSTGVSASEFIRQTLTGNPKASSGEVKKLWHEGGHGPDYSPTLYYQVRRRLGMPGRRRRRGRPPASASAAQQPTSGADYLAIERTLDKLIVQAEAMRDANLADALRTARRRVGAKLV